MSDIVYVIGNAKTVSPFKIGSTKEHLLTKRLSGIQTGNPIPLDVLQTFLVPPDQETMTFEKWLRTTLVKKFPKKLYSRIIATLNHYQGLTLLLILLLLLLG